MWVVIYQTNMGEVFGWFCQADDAAQAEMKFHQAIIAPEHATIQYIAPIDLTITIRERPLLTVDLTRAVRTFLPAGL